jgi:ribosome-binding protein aMBF1 (putative translation factor)
LDAFSLEGDFWRISTHKLIIYPLRENFIMMKTFESIENLVKFLRQRREELGISQKELAQLCNLSHNGISKLETDKREVKLSTLLKMSKILGFKLALEVEE